MDEQGQSKKRSNFPPVDCHPGPVEQISYHRYIGLRTYCSCWYKWRLQSNQWCSSDSQLGNLLYKLHPDHWIIILRVLIGWKFSYVQAGLISASIFSIALDKAKPVRNGLNFFRIMFYGLISERYFTLLNINSNFGYSQWLNEYDICELYKIISRRLILFVRWIQNMLGSITRWVHCLFWVYRVNNLFKVLWCNGYHFGLWIQQSEFESR